MRKYRRVSRQPYNLPLPLKNPIVKPHKHILEVIQSLNDRGLFDLSTMNLTFPEALKKSESHLPNFPLLPIIPTRLLIP